MRRILCCALVMMIALVGTASAESEVTVRNDAGINFIERMGLGFTVSDDMALRNGDILQTNAGSELTANFGDAYLTLGERGELEVVNAASDDPEVTLNAGEMLICVPTGSLRVNVNGHGMDLTDAVAFITARTGSASVTMLRGSTGDCGEGETVSYVGEDIGATVFSIAFLNEFAIEQIRNVLPDMELCIAQEDIDELVSQREAERQRAWEEQQAHDAAIIAQGGTEKQTVNTVDPDVPTCTIEIRCDTILDHMDALAEGKNSYVPSNGTILSRSTVAFDEGETVFEVLQRACEYAGIQLEYSWTPMYNSYYIEGINHLYEFDCGSESGWMYKVNEWFPNYGCSEYHLEDGDTIVWCYTCVGLGADVGGDVY